MEPNTSPVRALGMHAAEHIFAVPDITLHKSHMVLAGNIVHIAVDLKVSVLGRHVRAGLLHHMFSWTRQ